MRGAERVARAAHQRSLRPCAEPGVERPEDPLRLVSLPVVPALAVGGYAPIRIRVWPLGMSAKVGPPVVSSLRGPARDGDHGDAALLREANGHPDLGE